MTTVQEHPQNRPRPDHRTARDPEESDAAMTQHELNALAAAVAQMTKGPWMDEHTEAATEDYQETIIEAPPRYTGVDFETPVAGDMERRRADIAGIVALVNAAPDLLRLAQRALETQERRCETCREQIIQGDDPEPVCGLTMEGSPCYFYCEVFGNTCGAWQRREGLK